MFTKIGTIGVAVSDQNKALDFYVNMLGFEKIDDQPMSETERWLEVAPPGAQTHLMLGLRGQSGGDKVNSSPHRDFRHMCSAAFDEDKGLRFWAGSIDARSHSCSAALKNACDPAYRNRYSKLLDR